VPARGKLLGTAVFCEAEVLPSMESVLGPDGSTWRFASRSQTAYRSKSHPEAVDGWS